MKNKLLKTLGVGALCLTSALGLVACGGDKKTDEGYQKVEISKEVAYEMYSTAYEEFRYDKDENGEFLGNFWDGFELQVNVKMEYDGETTEYTTKFYRGMVDGKETFVDYLDTNNYHVYQTIDADNCKMWQKAEEGGTLVTTEGEDIWNTDTDLNAFAGQESECFLEAKKDYNGNYILRYVNTSDEADGDDPTKTWRVSTTADYYIDSNGHFTKCVIKERCDNFHADMTAEEIAEYDHSIDYTFTFDTSKSFNETWVKGLMTTVEAEVSNN